jgi:hypothetical protein
MRQRSSEPTKEERETIERAAALTDAAAALRAAIDVLTAAILEGTAIEKAEARDRFEIALAVYTARFDAP